jgi:predicted enzyme related to lactoylglutathione lyase
VPNFKKTTRMLKTELLKETVAFYTGVLGFQVETLYPEGNPTFCILDKDDISVGFVSDQDSWEGRPAMTGQLYLDVEDVNGIHEMCKGQVEIEWGPEVYDYGRREFCIKDPNGYALVFSEPTGNPPAFDAD